MRNNDNEFDIRVDSILPCGGIKMIPKPESLWDIQYYEEDALACIGLWLNEGADPNCIQENETLYENVLWKLREGEPDDYDYQRQLVQLLLAYGGRSPTYGYTWHFADPDFNIQELRELTAYQTFFRKVGNKYCKQGYIIKTDTGEEIGWL